MVTIEDHQIKNLASAEENCYIYLLVERLYESYEMKDETPVQKCNPI
jgi:hypothetical protein